MIIPNHDVIEVEAGEANEDKVCAYCHKGVGGPHYLGRYGPLYVLQDLAVHYFCVLFSPVLPHGEDHEGIFGYLYDDIKKDIEEGLNKICEYCRRVGATIQCSKEVEGRRLDCHAGGGGGEIAGSKKRKVVGIIRCSTNFHYSCARDEGVRFQFLDEFKAFCFTHATRSRRVKLGKRWECTICRDPAETDFLIKCSCCTSDENIFHMCCLQLSAWNLGYDYFKCPECGNAPNFKGQMKRSGGIYIPQCDADHFAEEDEEVAVNEEVLPQPVVCCRVVEDEDWEFYCNMRNALYSCNRIHLSLLTPWPKTISKAYPDGALNWENISEGGAYSVATSQGSYYYSGFLRLRPNEKQKSSQKKAADGFDLVLLVFKGTVTIKCCTVGRAGTGNRCRIGRCAKLTTQTVVWIQPGMEYSLENTSDTETILFYMIRKFEGPAEGSECRGQGRRIYPRITGPEQLNWKSPSEPGSASELVGIERCRTGSTSNQGFYKVSPWTCTGFVINKLGDMFNFVVSGQVRVRSSKFIGDMYSSNEDDDDDERDGKSVGNRCLVSEVYGPGTSFEIPYNCCYVVENWDDRSDRDPAAVAVLFYDVKARSSFDDDGPHYDRGRYRDQDRDREFPSSSRVSSTTTGTGFGIGIDD